MLVVNPLLRLMDALDKKARQLALNGPRTRRLALAGFVKRPQAANLLYASSVQIGAAPKYRRKPTMRQSEAKAHSEPPIGLVGDARVRETPSPRPSTGRQ